MSGWIAVDLDGTLAYYDGWRGADHIGAPIPAMIERVKGWLAEGKAVRIFTARVSPVSAAADVVPLDEIRGHIEEWCLNHLGRKLPVTHEKDFGMIELWDDRCVQMVPNTGQTLKDAFADQISDAITETIGNLTDRV